MVIKEDNFLNLLLAVGASRLFESVESPSLRKKRKQCERILILNIHYVVALIFEFLIFDLLVLEKHSFFVIQKMEY